jgi:arylsulfatase A-like enzyme
MGEWKAVRNGPKKPLELYNLKSDEAEKTDVAAQNPEVIAKAEKLMTSARTEDPSWPITENAKQRQQLRQKMNPSFRPQASE